MNWHLTDEVKFVKVDPSVPDPKYITEGAMAFDVTAWFGPTATVGQAGVRLHKGGGYHVFDTGLRFEIPRGLGMVVNVRSGLGFKYKVQLANNQGWIDSDYRGNLMVALINLHPLDDYRVLHGDRIAQCRIVQAPQIALVEVARLADTKRGEGGLGSTGR